MTMGEFFIWLAIVGVLMMVGGLFQALLND